jgi:hypothetical protein
MNWAYERAQKYSQEAMRNFAGMEMTDALRGLIQSQITLAYTTASTDAWQEATADVRLRTKLSGQFPEKPSKT